MFQAFEHDGGGRAAVAGGAPAISVVLPFFNERDFIEVTIESLAAQACAFRLILVDNGSTDGSGALALRAARALGVSVELIRERRPGKVAALRAGLAAVTTPLVATCDADCWYPPHYLPTAVAMLSAGAVAAGAYYVGRDAGRIARALESWHIRRAGRAAPHQCHAGGAGQAYRTDVLRAAGGFDPSIWNLVLEDHEIYARVQAHGAMAYHDALWCAPSSRKRDRASIRWTLSERLRYHRTPAEAQLSFFHDWLGPRLAARSLTSDRIRETPFHADAAGMPVHA
jgi:glycosyltransferase involved in cell wall biosynthesis